MKAMQIKNNLSEKNIARMIETQKGFHFTKKWTDGKGTKEDVVSAMNKAILTCKEIAKSDAFKEETRRRANELLPLLSQTKVQAGKLETTDEAARLAAWQCERYMNLIWKYETNDVKRGLKHPWIKVPDPKDAEPKDAEPKEEAKPATKAKAPAKAKAAAPKKAATTRKRKAVAPKEEDAELKDMVREHNEALFAQLLKSLDQEALERAIFRALYGEESK